MNSAARQLPGGANLMARKKSPAADRAAFFAPLRARTRTREVTRAVSRGRGVPPTGARTA